MLYAILTDGVITEYPVDLSIHLPNTSFPENWLWAAGEIEGVEYIVIQPTPRPDYNPATQNLAEDAPALLDGAWTQQWAITDASVEEVAERLAAKRSTMTCTPRQARLALAYAGLLEAVEAWVAAQGAATQIEWEYASEIRRADGLVTTAGTTLGMTEGQIDDLFAYAVGL